MDRSPLLDSIYRILDRRFRDFELLGRNNFPDYEFSEEEAVRLAESFNLIKRSGYKSLEACIRTEEGRRLLNTAAQFGGFAKGLGWAEAGVLIAAQALMEPLSSDYAELLGVRLEGSLAHLTTPQNRRCEPMATLSRTLMLFATFVRSGEGGPPRVDFESRYGALAGLQLNSIDLFVLARELRHKPEAGPDR